MSERNDPSLVPIPLRQQAEHQLRSGTAQLSTSFVASTDALSVLYRLSGAASTASDGLKLLHELQVHQVELDLQLEQLQHNEREFNHEQVCYQQFFAINPVACLMLSTDGIISQGNAAASRLFVTQIDTLAEPSSQQLAGRSLQSLLSATCRPLFSAAMARVLRNQQRATLLVTLASTTTGSAGTAANNLRLTINMSPDHKALLIMLT